MSADQPFLDEIDDDYIRDLYLTARDGSGKAKRVAYEELLAMSISPTLDVVQRKADMALGLLKLKHLEG